MIRNFKIRNQAMGLPSSVGPARGGALLLLLVLGSLLLGACGTDVPVTPPAEPERVDAPLKKLSSALTAEFNDGDLKFSTPLREADGLGPLYTRTSCSACHDSALRGPGSVQKMVVVESDGLTPSPDQSLLPYGSAVHPLTAGGATTPVLPPDDPSVRVTVRLGPPVLGRGFMEAIDDAELTRVEQEQAGRDDGIHGRINWVRYTSETYDDPTFPLPAKGDLVIGRFGLKARIPNLIDFTADAFQGDMGITSPLRPTEPLNPDGLTDDAKAGVDVTYASVASRAMYVRLIDIPTRTAPGPGAAVFEAVRCSVCHVPSLKTRSDFPVPQLAGVDAPVYSDLLLHRMGPNLSDSMPADALDGTAGPFDWRTAPLIGIRFARTFLHDGRAKTVEEAIAQHRGEGSEANDSVDRFDALSATDRQALIDFVNSL